MTTDGRRWEIWYSVNQCKIEYVAIGSKRDYTLEHNVGSNLHKHWSIESERQWILSCVRSDRAEPAEFNVPPICCLLRTLYFVQERSIRAWGCDWMTKLSFINNTLTLAEATRSLTINYIIIVYDNRPQYMP